MLILPLFTRTRQNGIVNKGYKQAGVVMRVGSWNEQGIAGAMQGLVENVSREPSRTNGQENVSVSRQSSRIEDEDIRALDPDCQECMKDNTLVKVDSVDEMI